MSLQVTVIPHNVCGQNEMTMDSGVEYIHCYMILGCTTPTDPFFIMLLLFLYGLLDIDLAL